MNREEWVKQVLEKYPTASLVYIPGGRAIAVLDGKDVAMHSIIANEGWIK